MRTDRGTSKGAEMDELLRRTLGNEAAAAGEDCPVPADVAAFVEGRLSGGERARLEQHFSACAACQETLAAIAGMPPAPATPTVAPRTTWLSPSRLWWLVPATAAAVILVAYVASNQLPKRAVREAASAPLAREAPRQLAMRSTGSPKATPPAESAAVTAERPKAAVAPQKASGPQAVAKALPGKLRIEPADQARPGAAGGASRVAERIEVAPREDARSTRPEMVRLRAGTADKALVADRAAPPADVPPGEARAVPAAPPPIMTEQRAPVVPRSLALAVQARTLDAVLVEAPDRRSLWRFVPDSGIWHSADAGASWQQQAALTSGRLAAGAAPDAAVCWAVGRDGLVMLTVDGARWQTASAPVRADLMAVQARDGRTATVTATDGRRFTTTDGGASWTPVQ